MCRIIFLDVDGTLINADGIIKSGQALMMAIDNGIGKIHRDTFHADLGVGRYLLGLIWYKAFTGQNATNDFNEFDIEVERNAVEMVKIIAQKM